MLAKTVQPPLQDHQLLGGGEVVDAGLLHRKADPPAHLRRLGDDVEARHRRTPGRRLDQGAEHPDRGRLARPVRAENPEGLSGSHAQRDAAHSLGAVRIGLGETLEHDRVGKRRGALQPLVARRPDELVQRAARRAHKR